MAQDEEVLLSSQVLLQPYVVTNGINLRGTGPLCTSGRGTNIKFKGKDIDGFVFGIKGDPYQQTGGCLEQCHIIKDGTGGRGVSLLAPSWEMRNGETCLDGLQIFGGWHTGIYIDGSNITRQGTQGVRRTIIGTKRGVRVHGADLALHAKNAVHLCVSNFQSDPNGTTGQAKVLIESGQNLLFNNLIINGDFEASGVTNMSIASSFINRIIIRGDCGGVSINGTCNYLVVSEAARGTFAGTINIGKTIKSKSFSVWSNLP